MKRAFVIVAQLGLIPQGAAAKGNIVDHEHKIERDGDKVAEVSKRWLRMRNMYGFEIAEAQDDALILAVTVCIDQVSHNVAG